MLTSYLRRVGAVVTTTLVVVLVASSAGAASAVISPSHPNFSQYFLSPNCKYALVVVPTPGSPNTSFISGLGGQRKFIEVDPIEIRDGGSCGRLNEDDVKGALVVGRPVELDMDGDGNYERSITPGVDDITVGFNLPNRSNHVYSISARWASADDGTVIGKVTVFVDVDCGVTINDGAEFTNSRQVIVTTNPCPGASAIRLSNDGGFKVREAVNPGVSLSWTLPSSRVGTFTKVIYGKYVGGAGGIVTDDIILDLTRPTLSVVTVSSRRGLRGVRQTRSVIVRTRARDTISGVQLIQITNNTSEPGAWRRYRKRIRFANSGSKLFVRVADHAGNVSRWRQVAAPTDQR